MKPATPARGLTAAEPLWWWDGRLVPESEVRLSPRDRGLRYGDGVYETVRVHRGIPFKLEEHLARMRQGLDLLGIAVDPVVAFPLPRLDDLLTANIGVGEGRLRMTVTRGVDHGNQKPQRETAPTLLAGAERLPDQTPVSSTQATRLTLADTSFGRPGRWSCLKSLNGLVYVLAAAEAASRDADDALLVGDGCLLETTSANVFVVNEGRLLTPDPACGLLAGVTRDTVLELARAGGLPVEETRVTRDHLRQAGEVFLTGSVAGLCPVASIDDHVFTAPGPVTTTLQAAYAELLERCSTPDRGDTSTSGATAR